MFRVPRTTAADKVKHVFREPRTTEAVHEQVLIFKFPAPVAYEFPGNHNK